MVMDKFFRTEQTQESIKDKSKNENDISKGVLEKQKYGNYYDINNTISVAQATNPNDPDVVTYNREEVYVSLQRNAEYIIVSNDNPIGGAILYVIPSHTGKQGFSRERPIYPQEAKTFYNIYEIRLRSPIIGSPYRITEYNLGDI